MSDKDMKNEWEKNENVFSFFLNDFFHIPRAINYIIN